MKNKTTDENVIRFWRAQTQSEKEQRAARAESQLERASTRVRSIIEAKFDTRPLVQSKQERIRLAHNLWQILTDVRPLVSTKDVLHAVGQGHGADLTKRLPYFALDPNLPELVRDKRAEKLAKHIRAYAKIASQAAQSISKDELTLIQQLVDGTWYSPLKEDTDAVQVDINVEGWINVETAIKEAASRISSKYNLPLFFKSVVELGIVVDRFEGGGAVTAPETLPKTMESSGDALTRAASPGRTTAASQCVSGRNTGMRRYALYDPSASCA